MSKCVLESMGCVNVGFPPYIPVLNMQPRPVITEALYIFLPPKAVSGVERKGIFDVAKLGAGMARFPDNFNDIETDKIRLYLFPLKVGDRRAGEVFSLFRIHRGKRTTEFLVSARFDLDENERAVVLRNNVYFIVFPHSNAPAKEFVVFGLQHPDRLPLTPSTGFQMGGFGSPV